MLDSQLQAVWSIKTMHRAIILALLIKKATDVFYTKHCGYVSLHFLLFFLLYCM